MGAGSAYKGAVHIALVIRGGKVTLSCNNMGGRHLDLGPIRGYDQLNSCHAECSVIAGLSARREPHKWQRKINRCRVYSLAFRYCPHTGTVRPSPAKPCRMCTQVMYQHGFHLVWYSDRCGTLLRNSIEKLREESVRSFGERRLEWLRDTRNLRVAQRTGDLVRLHLRDPTTFRWIQQGHKQIEGRLWRGVIRRIRRGDLVMFCCEGSELPAYVTAIRRYGSFSEMLASGDQLERTLPGEPTVESGVRRYHQLYNRRDQRRYDAVAIVFRLANVNLSVDSTCKKIEMSPEEKRGAILP